MTVNGINPQSRIMTCTPTEGLLLTIGALSTGA